MKKINITKWDCLAMWIFVMCFIALVVKVSNHNYETVTEFHPINEGMNGNIGGAIK